MKNTILIFLLFTATRIFGQCAGCPGSLTAPGAAAAPSVGFHGYTSEVKIYNGIAATCYTPSAGTLNGHLHGINNALCDLERILDSLSTVVTRNDSTTIADIDSIHSRLDSIVTALGQFYNTSVIAGDSTVRVSSTTSGNVITYKVKAMADSLPIHVESGLSGNGKPYNPVRIGGAYIRDTSIYGNHTLGLNIQQLTLTNKDTGTANVLLYANYNKHYGVSSQFMSTNVGSHLIKTSTVGNGTFNLSSLNTKLDANYISHTLNLSSSTLIVKTGDTTAIGYGDVTNLNLGLDGQTSSGGHVTSMCNLVLDPIFKSTNTLPYSVYRYISIGLPDLTQANGTPSDWIVPTDRYAIYQEGESDKNVFMGYMVLNLTIYADDAAAAADTSLPSGALYKVTGSKIPHIKD